MVWTLRGGSCVRDCGAPAAEEVGCRDSELLPGAVSGSSALPLVLLFKRNLIEVIVKRFPYSALKSVSVIVLKKEQQVFLQSSLLDQILCASLLMFLQESLKNRGQEKCPVCSVSLCAPCFQLRGAARRGFGDAKISKTRTHASRSFYFSMGDNKSKNISAIRGRRI